MSGNFIADAVEPVLLGLGIAFLVYWLLSKQPYSLRLIDLASFAFGFLALIAALLASYRERNDSVQIIERLIVQSTLTDIGFDTAVETIKICDRLPHTPFGPSPGKRSECDKLNQYVGTLKFNPELTAAVPLLDTSAYSDPAVHELAEKVLRRVKEANQNISQYSDALQAHVRVTTLETLFRDLSIPLLAFAFGLGVGRRTIDLYLTLPAPLKEPVQSLEYYVYHRGIAARRFFRNLRRRSKAQSRPSHVSPCVDRGAPREGQSDDG